MIDKEDVFQIVAMGRGTWNAFLKTVKEDPIGVVD